jgi:hypothetical protein
MKFNSKVIYPKTFWILFKILESLKQTTKTGKELFKELNLKQIEDMNDYIRILLNSNLIKIAHCEKIKDNNCIYVRNNTFEIVNNEETRFILNILNIVRELRVTGLSLEEISKYTKLSTDDIMKYCIENRIEINSSINQHNIQEKYRRKRSNISAEEYYALKKVKNESMSVILSAMSNYLPSRRHTKYDLFVRCKDLLKFFGWWNLTIHTGEKRIINNKNELENSTEKKFFELYSKNGTLYKLSRCYADLLLQSNPKNTLIEVKKQLNKNSFHAAVLELIMGEEAVLQKFGIKIDEKWIFAETIDNKWVSGYSIVSILDRFHVKVMPFTIGKSPQNIKVEVGK